jgi:hypothetical protein
LSTGGGGGEPGNIPVYTEIPLPVTQNNQTLFTNVVPDDAIVVGIDVGASVFHKGVSFNVINNNKDIQWINTGAPIDINDTVILKVWQL